MRPESPDLGHPCPEGRGTFYPVSPSAPNALRCPEKAPKALKCGTLTASLQLTMAFAACREWLHSAVFRPEMQLMQLLQLFAYKKTERHPGDTWGHRPLCLHRKEIANDYINYINYIYCLKMASFRRFRAFPLTAIRTAVTAFLQLTSSSRSRGAQIAFTLVDFGHAMKAEDRCPSCPPVCLHQPPTSQSGILPFCCRFRMIPPFSPSDSLRTHRRRLKVFAASGRIDA